MSHAFPPKKYENRILEGLVKKVLLWIHCSIIVGHHSGGVHNLDNIPVTLQYHYLIVV